MRINHFTCDKCGKEVIYNPKDKSKSEKCYHIDLGEGGYFSTLSDIKIEFDICDECLHSFLTTFDNQNILHSESEQGYETYGEALNEELKEVI